LNRLVIAGIAAALLVPMAGHAQQADPFARSRLEWNKPQTPFHVIGNIYYVGPAGVSAFLIVTPQGLILTDGGLPESAAMIEANIKALGYDIKNVKLLLNSHAHFDHAGGLAQLKRDSGATMVASQADTPILEKGRIDFGPSTVDPFPPVKVDRIVKDGDTIALGGVTLTASITPGHTPGCTNWATTLSEAGVPLKVLFFCSITTGGNPLVNNPQYPSIAADYKASFARLKTMDVDVFLAPHGDQMDLPAKLKRLETAKENPFIDRQALPRLIAVMERQFDAELARQQAAK
jgi:metallo-beta-lactamase class B